MVGLFRVWFKVWFNISLGLVQNLFEGCFRVHINLVEDLSRVGLGHIYCWFNRYLGWFRSYLGLV